MKSKTNRLIWTSCLAVLIGGATLLTGCNDDGPVEEIIDEVDDDGPVEEVTEEI